MTQAKESPDIDPMFSESVERALEEARRLVDDEGYVHLLCDHAIARGLALIEHVESPIEHNFIMGLIPYLTNEGIWVAVQATIYVPHEIRVDVYLFERHTKKPLAVELDGHEWHERTKAQAQRDKSRDRRLLEIGVPVMRFTGSEVHHDPHDCAQQAHDYLMGVD